MAGQFEEAGICTLGIRLLYEGVTEAKSYVDGAAGLPVKSRIGLMSSISGEHYMVFSAFNQPRLTFRSECMHTPAPLSFGSVFCTFELAQPTTALDRYLFATLHLCCFTVRHTSGPECAPQELSL